MKNFLRLFAAVVGVALCLAGLTAGAVLMFSAFFFEGPPTPGAVLTHASLFLLGALAATCGLFAWGTLVLRHPVSGPAWWP